MEKIKIKGVVMADILSQEAIDALLDVVEDEGDYEHELYENEYCLYNQRQVTLYDFKRPNRVSKEQLRAFRGIHDVMSKDLSVKSSGLLGSITEVQLHSADQMTYGEFLMSLPNPTSFNVFEIKPFEGKFILEINPSIVYPIIDRLLGGKGEPFDCGREFSNIESKIFEKFIIVFLNSLKKGWDNFDNETAPFLYEQHSSPNVIQVVAQNEIVIMIVMEIIVGHSSGMMNIAYPVKYIDPVLYRLTEKEKKGVNYGL